MSNVCSYYSIRTGPRVCVASLSSEGNLGYSRDGAVYYQDVDNDGAMDQSTG